MSKTRYHLARKTARVHMNVSGLKYLTGLNGAYQGDQLATITRHIIYLTNVSSDYNMTSSVHNF